MTTVEKVAAALREALDVCVDDGDGEIDPNGLAEIVCRALGVTEQIAFPANCIRDDIPPDWQVAAFLALLSGPTTALRLCRALQCAGYQPHLAQLGITRAIEAGRVAVNKDLSLSQGARI